MSSHERHFQAVACRLRDWDGKYNAMDKMSYTLVHRMTSLHSVCSVVRRRHPKALPGAPR